MRKSFLRNIACLLAALNFVAFTACDGFEKQLGAESSDSEKKESSSVLEQESTSEESGSFEEESSSESSEDLESSEDSSSSESSSSGETEEKPENKELDFTPAAVETKYGFQVLSESTNGSGFAGFYQELFTESSRFFRSSKDVDGMSANGDTIYSIARVPYSKYGLTVEEMITAWKAFRADYPEFWWFSIGITYTSDIVYLLIEPEYANGDTRSEIQSKLREMANDCKETIGESASELETALEIYDYLTMKLEYAYEKDGTTPENAIWAHNLVGGALYQTGVCETYAETYDYLCGLMGVECITAIGDAGYPGDMGGHAWNLVKIDGEWYNVDTTWGDKGKNGLYGFNLFSREYFGMNPTEFNETHILYAPDETDIMRRQLKMPAVSQSALCPVQMKTNGGAAVWEKSIDSAIGKMTNEVGRYEIILCPESKTSVKKGGVVYPYKASFSTALPNVAALKFTGLKRDLSKNNFWLANLECTVPMVLQSDLVLENIKLVAQVNKNGYAISEIGTVQYNTLKNILK